MGLAPVLVLLAVAVMLTPLVLAYRADRQIRRFQKEAFGHLQRAARNLRWMVWAILVYYLGVLGGSFVIGDLTDMMKWPMPADGLVIYLRIGAAIVGYVFASLVAQELYLVTRPRPLAKEGWRADDEKGL